MTFILVLRHSIEKPSLASFRCLIGLEAARKTAIWRHSGLMVSAVDSGPSGSGLSPDGGHCFVFFGKTLDSRRPFLAFPYFVRGRFSWCCCSLSRSKPGPCYWHGMTRTLYNYSTGSPRSQNSSIEINQYSFET